MENQSTDPSEITKSNETKEPTNKRAGILRRAVQSVSNLFPDKTAFAFIFSFVAASAGLYAMLKEPRVVRIETKVPVYIPAPTPAPTPITFKSVDLAVFGEVAVTKSSFSLTLTVENKGSGDTNIQKVYFKNIGQNIVRSPIEIKGNSTQKIVLSEKEAPFILKKVPLVLALSNGETKEVPYPVELAEDVSSQIYEFVKINRDRLIWTLIQELTRDLNAISSSDVKLFYSSVSLICQDLANQKDKFKVKLDYSKEKKEVELQKFYAELIYVLSKKLIQCTQFNSMLIADVLTWQSVDRVGYKEKYKFPSSPVRVTTKTGSFILDPIRDIEETNAILSNINILWQNRDNRTFIQLYNITLQNRVDPPTRK